MTTIRLAYIQEFVDWQGHVRRYFRRPGFKRVPLPGSPGSPEFMAAYEAAMGTPRNEVGAGRTIPGTVDDLVVRFYKVVFPSLSPSTQATYRGIIERFRTEHGSKRVAKIDREHVKAMVRDRAATPSAANNFLRIFRQLMLFAIDEGMRSDDPTLGVKKVPVPKGGIHTWTEDDIAAFEKRHPVGTMARRAMALMLYTGCRRGDVVALGRQHIKGGMLTYTQDKNRRRKPVTVTIPVHPDLAAILAAPLNDPARSRKRKEPAEPAAHQLNFVTTSFGKPFAKAGFGNWMRERCDEAALPDCSSHGLRKGIARRLAEAGCTPHQIMSITGHQTLKEVERYTKEFARNKAAEEGMATLAVRAEGEQASVKQA